MAPPSLTVKESATFQGFINDLRTLVDSLRARETGSEDLEGWVVSAETGIEPYRKPTTRLSVDDLQQSVTEHSLFGVCKQDKLLGHRSFYEGCVEDGEVDKEVVGDLERLWNQYWALILKVRGREIARGQAQSSKSKEQRSRLASKRSRVSCGSAPLPANWPQRSEGSVGHRDERSIEYQLEHR